MIETLRTAIAAADTKGSAAVGAAVDQVVAGVSSSVVAVNAILLLNLLGATDRAFDSARANGAGVDHCRVSGRPSQPVIRDQRRRKTNILFFPLRPPGAAIRASCR
jgi:hypothetical protein